MGLINHRRVWLDGVANDRTHATTGRVVHEAFAAERPALRPLPLAPYRAVLKLERRVSHEGMVSVWGNLYSVPDTTRRRILDVHMLADEVRLYEDGVLIARPSSDRRTGRRPRRSRAPTAARQSLCGPLRRRAFGRPKASEAPSLAARWTSKKPSRGGWPPGRNRRDDGAQPPLADRIRRRLAGLKMPRAIEVLDDAIGHLERGEITALEAIDILLTEELTLRESRRIRTALVMARLSAIKTHAEFDFSFQPSLERGRVMALAELGFVDRCETLHFLGPPDPAS